MSDSKRVPTQKKTKSKGPKTETIVRKFDDDGELVSETKTVVVVFTPDKDDQSFPGVYL